MRNRSVVISGLVTIAAGLGLMAVHNFGGSDGDPEGWFSAIGFGAPVVGAGALALVGAYFKEPALCGAGGVALGIISVVSIIMIPLLVPAGFMIASMRTTSDRLPALAVPTILAVALIAAFGYLVFHQDPASWTTADGSGFSSNIVTGTEAAISVIVSAAVVLGSITWTNQTAA